MDPLGFHRVEAWTNLICVGDDEAGHRSRPPGARIRPGEREPIYSQKYSAPMSSAGTSKSNEMARPSPQKIASNLSVSISAPVSDPCEKALAIAAKPAAGEKPILLAIDLPFTAEGRLSW